MKKLFKKKVTSKNGYKKAYKSEKGKLVKVKDGYYPFEHTWNEEVKKKKRGLI